MSYPQITDYQDAVQNPRNAFSDPELQRGTVAATPLGLPLALSGGFALTYTVQTGAKKLAVRCFHREVPDAQARYAAISAKLRRLGKPYFVDFDFQPKGIRIRGNAYPIVKMDWADGEILGSYLERHVHSRDAMAALRQAFIDLAGFLHINGIAHGDIQNENVIIANGTPQLIDYDGMFVAGMQTGRGTEVGHRHFQHPGRGTTEFGPTMDRFSFLVVDVSLEALQVDSSLHSRFREGGNAIIFTANDFADPSSSEVFGVLQRMPALKESATKLAAVCSAPVSSVPALDDFILGRNIPTARVQPKRSTSSPPAMQAYIGAYSVLDAKDFDAVMRSVGDKVELVGQIVSVFAGVGKRGKGRGRPYVFISFGKWNQESVKITIWSEGLSNMSTRPTDSWVGRWVSVTGLIEPPYEGRLYGKPYRNVGVTVTSDSQIVQISEKDAQFRLRQKSRPRNAGSATSPGQSNHEILRDVLSSTNSGGRTTSRAPSTRSRRLPPSQPVQSARTKNEQILQTIQPSSSGTVGTSAPSYRATPRGKRGSSFQIRPWMFWVAGVVILFLVPRRR